MSTTIYITETTTHVLCCETEERAKEVIESLIEGEDTLDDFSEEYVFTTGHFFSNPQIRTNDNN
jgi:hypothetical protein